MEKDKVEHILSQSFRIKAVFRDEFNFISRGIVLSHIIENDEIGDFIYIDSLSNKIYLPKVISLKSI